MMGASNAVLAYRKYAANKEIPPTSLLLLVYMAIVSKDADEWPWYGQGHAALAEHALGRPPPIDNAGMRAVSRAIQPLLKYGAITVDRRASVRRDGPSTVRYRLNLRL